MVGQSAGRIFLWAWLFLLPFTSARLLRSGRAVKLHKATSPGSDAKPELPATSAYQNFAGNSTESPDQWSTLALHLGSEGLEREKVLKIKTGAEAKVKVLEGQHAAVSCKGQVWSESGHALLGCRWEMEPSCGIEFEGCGFWDGTCVWDAPSGHVSKLPYCLRSGLCVPHGPGPGDDDLLAVKEKPEAFWSMPEHRHILGGTLDAIVVLTQPQWGAYYHFLIDTMTRFYWVKEQFPEVVASNNTYFHVGLVNEVAQAWARLWGIDTQTNSNRLLDGWWAAKKFYIPPSNGCANLRKGVDPLALRSFQASIRENLPFLYQNSPSERPMVLMVRRDPNVTKARSLTNWDAMVQSVQRVLPHWTMETFSDKPPLPSVPEVCAMFARASVVIGVHGAGLSNLVCSRKTTVVVELRQTPHSWDYQLLAMKLGLAYVGVGTSIKHLEPGPAPLPLVEQALQRAGELVPSPGQSGSPPTPTSAPILTPRL